jgi:TRAP-type mannitol/chloroaromatic compound transport system substrate-binding protein
LISAIADATNARSYAEYLGNNGNFLQRIASEGVEIRQFNDDVWRALGEASIAVLDESAAEDAEFAKVYESFKASRAKTADWNSKSEDVFLRQRQAVLGG